LPDDKLIFSSSLMRRAVCLVNVPHEGPALIGTLLAERGYQVQVVEVFRGERWPTDLSSQDFLVVMGGPMGVLDIGRPEYPWLAPVADLLRQRLQQGAPSLGICLGAQLLAHAAGARVAPMTGSTGQRLREVGWGGLQLHLDQDGVLRGLPPQMEVLHWHGDACELPKQAVLLASTSVCRVQMYRLGRSFGLQFHPEIDGPTACLWAKEDADFVKAANGPDGVEQLQAASPATAERTLETRRQLLSQILDAQLAC
jgi:GMP synthase-like glutamine amidotransferase